MPKFDKTRRYLRAFRNLLDYAVLHTRLRGPASPSDHHRPSILVVKIDGIGDYVLFSRSSWVYRTLHPDAEITLLCRSETTDLAQANPWFDHVVSVDIPRITRDRHYQVLFLRNLRRTRFEVLYQPTLVKSVWAEAIARLARTRLRVAIAASNTPQRNYLFIAPYDIVFPAPPTPTTEPQVYDSFAHDLLPSYQPRLAPFWFPDDLCYIDSLVASGRLPSSPFVLFFAGAGADYRRWPTQNWIDLGHRLLPFGFPIVLAGSNADHPQNSAISAGLHNSSVFDVTGLTTVRHLAALISRASALVSNETSAIHLGANLNIPNVCIMGGGHWQRFYPYGNPQTNRVAAVIQDCFSCDWICIKDHSDCVSCIPVDTVWNELLQLSPFQRVTPAR